MFVWGEGGCGGTAELEEASAAYENQVWGVWGRGLLLDGGGGLLLDGGMLEVCASRSNFLHSPPPCPPPPPHHAGVAVAGPCRLLPEAVRRGAEGRRGVAQQVSGGEGDIGGVLGSDVGCLLSEGR